MKKRKTFILLFIYFLSTSLFAQRQENVDSLLAVLNTAPQDTVKVDIYFSLSNSFFTEDTLQTKNYLHKAEVLSEKIGDHKRICRASMKLAYFYLYHGKLPKCREELVKAKKQLSYFDDTSVEANFYRYSGIAYNFSGHYDLGVSDLLNACSLFESLKDSAALAHCYLNLGISHMDLKNYDTSLEYYQKSLGIYKALGDEKRMGNALGNIGIIYKHKQEYDKAIDYYQQSYQINNKYGFKSDARMDLNNLGVLYEEKGDFIRALEYHKKAKIIADSLGLPQYILTSDFNLALVEYRLKHYQKSIDALKVIIEAAKEKKYKSILKSAYKVLSDAYEDSGKPALALDSRKHYDIWKDSLMNENYLNQVAELETKYESEKKDQQIVLLDQQRELQEKETQRQATLKNVFIGGLLLIALMAGLIYYTFLQRLKNHRILAFKNEEINQSNYKRQLTELEMKALQSQINPHFIFNCLNSINHMILEGDRSNASKYLTKFSKLIRLILENAENTEVSLKSEIALLEAYIQLESLRFNGVIQHQIEIKEGIDLENTYLPSMVLQPFVENAIWHGLLHKKELGNGQIHISMEQQDDLLVCTIEDNGVGRQKSFELQQKSVYKSKSLGLKITEDRLRLLSKGLQRQLIEITDLRDRAGLALGTRVTVNIPIS